MAIVIMLIVSGFSSSPSGLPNSASGRLTTSSNPYNPGFTRGNLSGMVSRVYNEFAQNLSGTSGWPTQSSTLSTAWSLYSSIQNVTAFGNLVYKYNPGNFTISLNAQKTQGITKFYFGESWETPALRGGSSASRNSSPSAQPNSLNNTTMNQYTEYWTANLLSDTVSGPATVANTNATNASGVITRVNWSGFEFYYPGTVPLTQTYTDTRVQKMNPPNVGPCCTPWWAPPVQSVVSTWLGISETPGGGGGLWQTGYTFDTTNGGSSSCYQLWYEFYPRMPVSSYYPGYPCVNVGDWVQFDLGANNANSTWWASVYDFSTGSFAQTYRNLGSTYCVTIFWWQWCYTFSYTPFYAQNIVEAPTIYGQVQQIPKYQPVNFTDTYVLGSGSSGLQIQVGNWFYSHSYFNIYNMDQNCGTSNTNQNWINGNGYGGSYGYSQESWVTSSYNWWCV
jgi:hypothetical protein